MVLKGGGRECSRLAGTKLNGRWPLYSGVMVVPGRPLIPNCVTFTPPPPNLAHGGKVPFAHHLLFALHCRCTQLQYGRMDSVI